MSTRQLERLGDAVMPRGSDLDFCKHPGCPEFAQTSDPEAKDIRKYYCAKHEAQAIARGEDGKRVEFKQDKNPGTNPVREEKRNREMKRINADLAAGRIPGQSENPERARESPTPSVPKPTVTSPITLQKENHMPKNGRQFKNVDTGEVFDDIAAAVLKHSVNESTLRTVLAPSGKGKKCGGHHWEWLKDSTHSPRNTSSTPATPPPPPQASRRRQSVKRPLVRPEPISLPTTADFKDAIADVRELRPELPVGAFTAIETLLPTITQAIAAIALSSPGNTIENVSLGMNAGGIRVDVQIKSLRVTTLTE